MITTFQQFLTQLADCSLIPLNFNQRTQLAAIWAQLPGVQTLATAQVDIPETIQQWVLSDNIDFSIQVAWLFAKIYLRYVRWCAAQDCAPVKEETFAQVLVQSFGCEITTESGTRIIHGLHC